MGQWWECVLSYRLEFMHTGASECQWERKKKVRCVSHIVHDRHNIHANKCFFCSKNIIFILKGLI